MSQEGTLEEKTQSLIQRLGEKNSKLRFNDLLEYASEVCLTRQPDYASVGKEASTIEQRIVIGLGVRGIRAAVELADGHVIIRNNPDELEDEEVTPVDQDPVESERFFIDLDSPMVYPETWSDPLEIEIINKTKLFGESLLAEAYQAIGNDVYKKIDELKVATTVEEQMAVLKWLDGRIRKMTHGGLSDDDFDEATKHFYHPARLSPKLTGVYPDNALRPTCLSVSIIATSFFQKAGMTTLHAGVNESGSEKSIGAGIVLTGKIHDEYLDKFGVELGDPSKLAIRTILKRLIDSYKREDAQHAATLIKMADGRWAQFDPNYLATFLIEEKSSNEQLDKTYAMLDDMRDIAPGLEVTNLLPGDMPPAEILESIFERQIPQTITALRATVRNVLEVSTDESVIQNIYKKGFYPFYKVAIEDEYLELLQKAAREAKIVSNITGKPEPVLQAKFYDMFNKYVLWGDSIEEFNARIKSDPSYLHNRIEDIVALPFMTAISIAKMDAEGGTPWYTHHKLDIGLPAIRIGYAVLSDFDAYDDESDLPDSFWMSYWPGNVSVIEHLSKDSFSMWDKNLVQANAAYYDLHPFTSTKNYEIIKAFLQTHREEEKDGETDEG